MIEEDFFVLLDRLRDMPEGLIGIRSLRRMACFMEGWCYAHKNENVNRRLWDFNKWIHEKFGFKNSSAWWPDILSFFYGEEQKGFEEFWRLYDEFNEELKKNGALV